MRLFCFSDTHQKPLPECDPSPDVWLFAGDLYNRQRLMESSSADIEFQKVVLSWKEKNPQRVFAVRGNHDVNDSAQFFGDSIDLTEGAVRQLDDNLWIAGLGWAGRQFYELPTENDIHSRCDVVDNWLPEGARFILLTHYPPHDPSIFPWMLEFEGYFFKCLTRLIEKRKPIAIIAGHVHDQFGKVAKIHGSTIVFPGPSGKLLNVDDSKLTFEYGCWEPSPSASL